jgi:hypothetical protein
MIEKDNQLEVTLNAISKFATSIANLANVDRIGTTTNDKLRYLSHLASLVGELDVLSEQVSDYLNYDIDNKLIDKLKGVRVVQLLSNHQLEQLNQLRQTDMYEALDTLSNWVQAMNNNNDVPDELQAVYDRVWEMEKHNI